LGECGERTKGGGGVSPFSGEVQLGEVDLAIPGRGLDFIWARTYHSRLARFDTSANGWTFSYDVRCAQNTSGGVDMYDGTGARTCSSSRPTAFTPARISPRRHPHRRRLSAHVRDTGYWEFNPFDGSGTAGKIARIVDRNGNSMSLNYNGSGLLTQIVDDLDRTNTVAYNSDGRLAGVTDFSGRTVTYQYYRGLPGEQGARAIWPPSRRHRSPGRPTEMIFPRQNHGLLVLHRLSRRPRKSFTPLGHDAQGQTVSLHIYQHNQTDFDFLRCVSLQCWTNTPAILTYLPQTPTPSNQFAVLRCIMNDPIGNVTECFYDARNRCVKLQEFTGRATAGVPVTATVNRPKGQLRSSDPVYFECRAEWNNDSLCRKLIMFGGQQSSAFMNPISTNSPTHASAPTAAWCANSPPARWIWTATAWLM